MIARLLAGSRGFMLSAGLGAAIASASAWHVRGWRDSGLIGAAVTAQTRAEKELSDLMATIASHRAELERARADEQTKALNSVKAQGQRILDLQARLGASERERLVLSTKLKEELSDAPDGDARELGPAALSYLERVRTEQATR